MTEADFPPRTLRTRDGRDLEIRWAEPDDAAAVLAYLHRVGGETPFLSFGAEGPGVTVEEERALIERYRLRDNTLFLLVTSGDEIVAALTFEGGTRRRLRHVGEFGISVTEGLHGQGIGRTLLTLLIEWARRGGIVRKINLRVRPDNAGAIALYESFGFTTEGRLTRDSIVDGEFHDVLLMGLAL